MEPLPSPRPRFFFFSSRFIRIICAFLIFCTLVFFVFASAGSESSSHLTGKASIYRQSSYRKSPPPPKSMNETLGFQEILYISMPYRTDRQDAMALIAANTGLRITLIPGIDPKSMHPKSHPPGIPDDMHTHSSLGVWRAHANAWRHIVDNDISTALIIEDDIDWDINIKRIMGLWAWQLRYNNTLRWGAGNESKGWREGLSDQDCVYGCDWDELFMGQCGNTPNPKRPDLYQTYHDPDSPALSSHTDLIRQEIAESWGFSSKDSNFRIIEPTYAPLCAMGYAVSRIGAMRMLYQIGGWRGIGMPVDNELAFRSQEGKLSGYTLSPPVFVAWRTGSSRDSDNNSGTQELGVNGRAGKDENAKFLVNMNGWSRGLEKSARKSLADALDKDYWVERERQGR